MFTVKPFRTNPEEELQELLDNCHGTVGALIASDDGFVVHHVLKSGLPKEKIAAITSSLLGLAESAAYEGRQGNCKNVIVENELGMMLYLRINRQRVLTVLADTSVSLGMLLSSARRAQARLAELAE